MLSKDKLDRINVLARKERTEEGLSPEEKEEQASLRQEYIKAFRANFRGTLENTKIIDPEGKDVTPDKIKKIQKDRGLHNR